MFNGAICLAGGLPEKVIASRLLEIPKERLSGHLSGLSQKSPPPLLNILYVCMYVFFEGGIQVSEGQRERSGAHPTQDSCSSKAGLELT